MAHEVIIFSIRVLRYKIYLSCIVDRGGREGVALGGWSVNIHFRLTYDRDGKFCLIPRTNPRPIRLRKGDRRKATTLGWQDVRANSPGHSRYGNILKQLCVFVYHYIRSI
jgi:hypothetical protein